jgi:hypothetical protein
VAQWYWLRREGLGHEVEPSLERKTLMGTCNWNSRPGWHLVESSAAEHAAVSLLLNAAPLLEEK